MERRKEPRLYVSQPVTVTLIEGRVRRLIEACVLDISNSGLQLRLPTPLPCGAAIEIEGEDALAVGEVCRCEPEKGAYRVGVKVSQTLSSLMELELLNRALIGEGKGREVESPSESRVSRR
jgi:hypothetical protein